MQSWCLLQPAHVVETTKPWSIFSRDVLFTSGKTCDIPTLHWLSDSTAADKSWRKKRKEKNKHSDLHYQNYSKNKTRRQSTQKGTEKPLHASVSALHYDLCGRLHSSGYHIDDKILILKFWLLEVSQSLVLISLSVKTTCVPFDFLFCNKTQSLLFFFLFFFCLFGVLDGCVTRLFLVVCISTIMVMSADITMNGQMLEEVTSFK